MLYTGPQFIWIIALINFPHFATSKKRSNLGLVKFVSLLDILILPHLGHYRNDTVGPYFDIRAMGYTNMVHYWHFKKEIGSPLLNFGGLLDFTSISGEP